MNGLYPGYHSKNRRKNDPDKIFLMKIARSLIAVFLCLISLTLSAYAYFSSGATSKLGVIQTAYYDMKIEPLETVQTNGSYYILDNVAGTEAKSFKFNISLTDLSTASIGYCKVLIKTDVNTAPDDYQTLYTMPIGKFLNGGNMVEINQRTLSIVIPAGKTAEVGFISEWGTYTGSDIIDDSVNFQPAFATQDATQDANQDSTPEVTQKTN